MKKKLLLVLTLPLLCGCEITPFVPGDSNKPKITVTEHSLTMHDGESHQFTGKVTPSKFEEDMVWAVMIGTDPIDESKATITQNGYLTVLDYVGSFDVYYAYIGGGEDAIPAFDKCSVTVKENPNRPDYYESISFANSSYSFSSFRDSLELHVTGTPSAVKKSNITYSVENTNVAEIVDGVLYPVSGGSTKVTATAEGGATCSMNITVSSSSSFSFSGYDVDVGSYTSNFTSDSVDYINYGLYRAGKDSGSVVLYPSNNLSTLSDISLPGSINNNTAFKNASRIDISYKGEGVIRYGTSTAREETITLNEHTSLTEEKYIFPKDCAYLSIEASSILYVDEFEVYVDGQNVSQSVSLKTNDYRVDPVTFYGSLVDGVSTVDVPIEYEITSDNKVKATKTKEYTYYSFNYVSNYKSSLNLEEIAMTDPIDIANYYLAFGCIPSNFAGVTNSSDDNWISESTVGTKTQVKNIFGNLARQVSQYDRTDGYAEAVPYKWRQPYLEFDFDGDGTYSLNARGSNRVVIWSDCWTNSNGYPVAVYTDDHYETFREYLNYGAWGEAFKAEDKTGRVARSYGNSTTLPLIY